MVKREQPPYPSLFKEGNKGKKDGQIAMKNTLQAPSKMSEVGVTSVAGFKAAGMAAGIKKNGRPDLALLVSDVPCTAAALLTRNRFPAPPVLLTKRHLRGGSAQAVVINSGNANAFTGEAGLRDAEAMAAATATALSLPTRQVLVASTGVIGEPLPITRITTAIPTLAGQITTDGGGDAATAIMTTDTYRKEATFTGPVGKGEVRIGGMAKGSGMIHPNMATMLAFLTTDVSISPALLRTALRDAVDASFHAITVDGETSTNDMVLCMANGKSGVAVRDTGKAYRQFLTLLRAACWSLAQKIVGDGEGATKQIQIDVTGAKDDRSARKVAMAIAQSPLVKTAFFGEDANWGRIVCAIGNAGVLVDPKKIGLTFGQGTEVPLIRNGVHLGREAETAVASLLKEKEIVLAVSLGRGQGKSRVLTCDLSLDYVKINAAYRT